MAQEVTMLDACSFPVGIRLPVPPVKGTAWKQMSSLLRYVHSFKSKTGSSWETGTVFDLSSVGKEGF